MKKFFNNAFLCFSLLFLSSVVYAQSSDPQKVVLEKIEPENNDILKEENPKRDLDIYSILPIVLYNVTEDQMTIASH